MTNRALLVFEPVDLAGNPKIGQEVTIYEADGTTLLAATMYAANTGGTTLSNPLTVNAQGQCVAYLTTPQRVVARANGNSFVLNVEPDPSNYLTNPISPSLFTGHAANRLLGTTDDATLTMFQATTAMIAANAVTNYGFASGSTADPTTTSGSFVTLEEMDITLSCQGGAVLLLILGTFQNTAAGNSISLGFDVDAAGSAQYYQSPMAPVNNYSFLIGAMALITGLSGSAGSPVSHQFRGRWATSAGTAKAVSTSRFMAAINFRR